MASEEAVNYPANMSATEINSERSQLISSSYDSKPSYMNLISNICAIVFITIITYSCFKNGVSLFSFHPIFMSIGWLLLMTSAVNAITPGDMATEWMPIRLRSARHWVIQVFAIIIILIGFLIILSNKIINGKDHFVTLHAKFGLSSFIFMVITSFGGLGALYSLKIKHYIAPLYTKIIHSTVGLLTFSLGVITIILGCFSSWWNSSGNGEFLRYISLVLVLITMILTLLRPSLKVYFRLKEKLGYSN